MDEKTVLFDTVDKAVYSVFLENVAHGLAGRPLDYLVVHHMEPDHAATLELLVERYPEAKIVCNAKIKTMLAQFFPMDLTHDYLVKRVESMEQLYQKQGEVLDGVRKEVLRLTQDVQDRDKKIIGYESEISSLNAKVTKLEKEVEAYKTINGK